MFIKRDPPLASTISLVVNKTVHPLQTDLYQIHVTISPLPRWLYFTNFQMTFSDPMAVSHNFFGVDSDDDSLSSNTDRPTRMLHRPSEAEWEEHRPLIEHFYMVENMTLKELMKAMRLSCNFVAT